VGEDTPADRVTRRRACGEDTRRDILGAALKVASVEGLEGLTIGRLATELGMSKAGLFAHFGSKEALQLATVDAAQKLLACEVVSPAAEAPAGISRLRAMLEAYLSFGQRRVLPGGCFFTAAATEFDHRPGPVRDRIAAVMRDWMSAIERSAREAQACGEIDSSEDPAQLAYEMHALTQAAGCACQLLGDEHAYDRARRAIERRLAIVVVRR
jgi:AcrR family transcriptional regulator